MNNPARAIPHDTIDPRTPVLVGVGQSSERIGDPGYRRRSPVASSMRLSLIRG